MRLVVVCVAVAVDGVCVKGVRLHNANMGASGKPSCNLMAVIAGGD